MAYRRFEVGVAARVLSILAVCTAFAWVATATDYYATLLVLALVLAMLVTSLLAYVRRTNRDLSRFLLAVRHADFSQTFRAASSSAGFAELSSAFEEILSRFRAAHAAEEQQASYLDTVVRQVPVAILAWDETGRIDLFNRAAQRLLGVDNLNRLGDYEGFGPNFAARLASLEPGGLRLVDVTKDGELLQLSIAAADLRLGKRRLRIATLQDIRGALEARELAAWQTLIRILTHEIMNSVTPIASLAETAADLLSASTRRNPGGVETAAVERDDNVAERDPEKDDIADARQAVETIGARSMGLLRFVESYRRLTRLPAPVRRPVGVDGLFANTARLMGPELDRRGIALRRSVTPQSLEIDADPDLIDQALINLVRNAVDALPGIEHPEIGLHAGLDPRGKPVLTVSDNGRGIEADVREQIFVPFFTTKRDGTGVGLSLVRQIVQAHGGTINVRTAPGQGTEMRLTL